MKLNVVDKRRVFTHEGAVAQKVGAFEELQRTVLTCLLWEDSFYEKGSNIAKRIADLVTVCEPIKVANLAIKAREEMKLRHVPLLLVRELARRKGTGPLVASTLERIIQRADELTEFLAMYWKDKKQPLSKGVKKGLGKAFTKFGAYALAKYNREGSVKLRDVLFLTHAKPKDTEQAEVWKKLVDNTLESPDTWEVALSGGADKKETFERLLSEGKLGGLAVLRNLRNMQQAGVDDKLIRERLSQGVSKALPFRFVTAARYAPTLEDALEVAMLKGVEELETLSGSTGLLVDVSGSMDDLLSNKGETRRIDAAAGLAIYLREKAQNVSVATFSTQVAVVPPRRGFALRDAVVNSQPHGGTWLKAALDTLKPHWQDLDRIIVITDEQSHDGIMQAWTPRAYVVNVAPYQYGIGYGNGWSHINGWSERIIDYITAVEKEG